MQRVSKKKREQKDNNKRRKGAIKKNEKKIKKIHYEKKNKACTKTKLAAFHLSKQEVCASTVNSVHALRHGKSIY